MDSSGREPTELAEISRLEQQYRCLRRRLSWTVALVVALQALTVIGSGTVALYLLWLARTTNKDLTALRPQATQMINDYQRLNVPLWSDFLSKATEYGKTHPDFAPILVRYGIKLGGTTGAAPSSAVSPLALPSRK